MVAPSLGTVLALVPGEEPHPEARPALGIRQLEEEEEVEAPDSHVPAAWEEGKSLASQAEG